MRTHHNGLNCKAKEAQTDICGQKHTTGESPRNQKEKRLVTSYIRYRLESEEHAPTDPPDLVLGV